jgi:hypothetical protein
VAAGIRRSTDRQRLRGCSSEQFTRRERDGFFRDVDRDGGSSSVRERRCGDSRAFAATDTRRVRQAHPETHADFDHSTDSETDPNVNREHDADLVRDAKTYADSNPRAHCDPTANSGAHRGADADPDPGTDTFVRYLVRYLDGRSCYTPAAVSGRP